ncbi:hypothetical protein SAMN05216567_109155 [Variovorax sp. OK605]|jgi:hypothetical protein|uniref:hypothetical protein n=1 Tax=unclassified Variovorax TaxID=663243 RepID=UPI0008E00E49|nr:MULTISPECIES: hypothetical protein [unclassified Variovorax]SFP85658.1 hypothetical protein SAMN05216567_109155 [Variovorax sp. OK605]
MNTIHAEDPREEVSTERRAMGWSAVPIVLALALLACEAFTDPSRGFEARLIETLAVMADHAPLK